MHTTLERPTLPPLMLPPLAPPPRDRRMDITTLCDSSSSASSSDLYELEVQAQMQQMSHHSWPLYRVEQDRILDRRDWRASSTQPHGLNANSSVALASSSSKPLPPAMMLDNPLVVAASSARTATPTALTSYAQLVPPLHQKLAPQIHVESPIAVLSTVALATLPSLSPSPSAQRPPPVPQATRLLARKPSTATAAVGASSTAAPSSSSSKKRSRRMSNSERGKLYRSRRKTYVESLESDVQELAQEVQGLQLYGSILQEMALHTPQSLHESYSRVVAEYFAIFAAGMPVDADDPPELALVRPTPRQSVFVSTLMDADMAFCGTGGPKRLLRNWQCFSLYHASLSYSLKQLHVVVPDRCAAVVTADAVLRVRLTRATVEKMFPHVLWNAALVQRLVGLDVEYNVGNVFYFSDRGKICRYESHVDFLSAFMAALGSLTDAIELAGPITERQQREQLHAPTDELVASGATVVAATDDSDATATE